MSEHINCESNAAVLREIIAHRDKQIEYLKDCNETADMRIRDLKSSYERVLKMNKDMRKYLTGKSVQVSRLQTENIELKKAIEREALCGDTVFDAPHLTHHTCTRARGHTGFHSNADAQW